MGPVVPKHMSTDQLLVGVTAALTMYKEETVGTPEGKDAVEVDDDCVLVSAGTPVPQSVEDEWELL